MMATPMVMLRQPTAMDRVSRVIANVTLSMLGLFALVFFITMLYPWEPITRLEIQVVGESRVNAGLVVAVDYCKARAWPPDEVRWALVNDITVVLPTTLMSMPVGCHVKQLGIPMPIHAIPGTYQLQEELIYRPWPWKTYTYVRRSQPFTLKGAG